MDQKPFPRLDNSPDRARSKTEISDAVKRCVATCKGTANAAWVEFYVSGLLAVGWSEDDATAVKVESLKVLAKR